MTIAPSSDPVPHERSLTALVIDDDDFLLDVVEDLLRDAGVSHVVRATDGAAGLAALDAAEAPVDLVLCDLNMPGMDGIELARHLAGRRFQGGIALMSGVAPRLAATVGHLVRRHELRFLGALPKPLDAEGVRRAVSALLATPPSARTRSAGVVLTVDEVRQGLEAGDRVEAWLQPKTLTSSRTVVGAECLARWRDPVRGVLPPSAFVDVAEENGLIAALTGQIYAAAVARLAEWQRVGVRLGLSVNVSMEELTQLCLPDRFAAIAGAAGVDPGQITLEVTESRVMRDPSAALEILTRLRLKGFGLSIDDFGTGYSNLATLKLLPFTELKVDRAFVHGAGGDPVARAILESSVRLARVLDMALVAEGAETDDDVALLRSVGCERVQGYVVARPMPAGEFLGWKARWEGGE